MRKPLQRRLTASVDSLGSLMKTGACYVDQKSGMTRVPQQATVPSARSAQVWE
jgi:hypothetical protein